MILDLKNKVHRFKIAGRGLLLDINSGAVHLLDEIAWDFLESIERHGGSAETAAAELSNRFSPEEISEVLGELEGLQRSGVLASNDLARDFIPDYELKSLCLNVAHDCNLRCKYCFAGTGNFGGSRKMMDFETGRAALEVLLAQSKRHFCEVDFFGGEPLLNFEVVKRLVEYGKARAAECGKVIRFTLTTNGVLLDADIVDFLNREELQVVLSCDGRREIHDAMRPFPGGKGSFPEVLSGIRELTNSRDDNYYIRGTFTAANLDFSEDVVELAELGFKEISLEPVVSEPHKKYAIKEEHLPCLEAEYEKLAQVYLDFRRRGKPFDFFHFNLDLEKGPCLPKRLTSCGAGYQYLAVSPDGELYPCHQFVGRKEFVLGTVEEGIIKKSLSDQFRVNTVHHKKQCGECWARYFCSGGCRANGLLRGGSIDSPDRLSCGLMRKRLECALYVQAMIKMEGQELFD